MNTVCESTTHTVSPGTVLVTGSSRGIGRAIAMRLARDGYDLVLHCRSRLAEAEAVANEIEWLGGRARVLMFDVTDRAEAARFLSDDIEAHGTYYGVVCNAGLSSGSAFQAMNGNDWDHAVHTNLDAFYNVLNPLVKPMVQRRKAGRIVTLSAATGLAGDGAQTMQGAANAGIVGATKALAMELAKCHITCNCVAPGLIDTALPGAGPGDKARAVAMRAVPMQRVGTPADVAGLVAFLMRPEAGYITRQVISVNGGMDS
ncbi:3-oxoacyl-ACP reductase FabG [soil metagenome]